MGSGTSRGKKVAPACVRELNATSQDAAVTNSKQDVRSLQPNMKIRDRAQPDCHSEGHDSEFSAEDDDIDAALDPVLASGYEEQRRVSERKSPPKKSFIRAKAYGLCNFSRVHADDFKSAPQVPTAERAGGPRGSHGGSRGGSGDVNKRGDAVFNHVQKHTPPCNDQHTGLLIRGPCVEPVPRSDKESSFGSRHSPSLATPVTLYDGSEEELMDTIEREFS